MKRISFFFLISFFMAICMSCLQAQTLQVALSPDKSKVDRDKGRGMATIFFESNIEDLNISLTEHNEEEYWTNLVDEGKAGVAFTSKEARSNFTFSFPEMNRTLIITGVTIILLAAFGLFIFWPKKSYVPTEEVDRETYTFASTDEKEKYALAKVARSKKEKEDRENRYKNVRTDSNLENMSNEAIKESMDKENTAEAALAEDAKLEAEETKENETKEEN